VINVTLTGLAIYWVISQMKSSNKDKDEK